MVPAEHPLWAQMFSSAIKPEIITGGTWDKEQHELQKKQRQSNQKTKPKLLLTAKLQRPLWQSAVEILFLVHDSEVSPENAV